jgi:hypothetical protein
MTSVKSLAARFYRPKSGHAPTGAYIKRFRYRETTYAGSAQERRSNLFRYCSRWKDEPQELWKDVRICDQAVMDFLAATDVGKFPPK